MMNLDFSLPTQPNSMFVAMNIESGFTMKPNCGFMFVKRDLGWQPERRDHAADGRAPWKGCGSPGRVSFYVMETIPERRRTPGISGRMDAGREGRDSK